MFLISNNHYLKFFLVQNSFEIGRDSPYRPRVLSQSGVSCVWEGIISERKAKSCSLQISLNKFCRVLVLRHYLFKRDRRPKDFPHLVHLWPSSSFSFCFSLPSSLTSGGGEISSSSSPAWVCCWLTPMFFLPSKNVGSPLKAMACSRSLIAASWKRRTWFYFWRKELINLNVRPSFRGVGDEVLVKSGFAGKGFVAVAARQLWKDPDRQ